MGCLRAAKPALQFVPGKLHHRGPAVHIMWGQLADKEPIQQGSHLFLFEFLPSLDSRFASICCSETLESVQPGQSLMAKIGNQFFETPPRVESRMRIRNRVYHNRLTPKPFNLESNGV